MKYLLSEGALGDVRDAQIHFDFPDPSWIGGWTQKEYVPGEGMAFGLGETDPDPPGSFFNMHEKPLPVNQAKYLPT